MNQLRQVKLLPVRFRLAQADRIEKPQASVKKPRQVKLLPDRFRLAQTDRGDITLSVSESATSSEIAS